MKKILFVFILFSLISQHIQAQDSVSLRQKAAQMLIVGFRGIELSKDNPIYYDITENKIGGIILFEYDVPAKRRSRNISSPKQVAQLNKDLQELSGNTLFISVDQEGGYVDRLKKRYGFPETRSAQYLGKVNNYDTTYYWAKRTAEILKQTGFNLNFAPDTDVNINPQSPIIGKIERSFSANPYEVAEHARIWIDAQHEYGIMNSIKHFPGHGSAKNDTHLGMVDVTNTWTEEELIPFETLTYSFKVDMVMTSHIVNRKLDSVPATLSYNILNGLLRQKLGYNGIIVSDDIAMGAIADHYPLEKAIEMAVNAGVDILILSNNGSTFDPQIATKAIDIICRLVDTGKIPQSRIEESYNRIKALKHKNGLYIEPDYSIIYTEEVL